MKFTSKSKYNSRDFAAAAERYRQEHVTDVSVVRDGLLFLFVVKSDAAREWISKNVREPRYWGDALVVEFRYGWEIAEVMRAEGLVLR
jgi:hypothetical protein